MPTDDPHRDEFTLTYADLLVARTAGPGLATLSTLWRARQQVDGDLALVASGDEHFWSWFDAGVHGVAHPQRIVGHHFGETWHWLAVRPPSRAWCRDACAHLETPVLWAGAGFGAEVVLVQGSFNELLPSFDANEIMHAIARATDRTTCWFSAAPSNEEERRLEAAFDPGTITDVDLRRVRKKLTLLCAKEAGR